jgi:hypothetical protein
VFTSSVSELLKFKYSSIPLPCHFYELESDPIIEKTFISMFAPLQGLCIIAELEKGLGGGGRAEDALVALAANLSCFGYTSFVMR